MHMYMLLYLKWTTTRGLLSSTGNSARHYVAAWMGGEFGENGYVYMYAESLCRSPETITTLSINYFVVATHSSILAWRIPWTEDMDRLQSMSQRVGHD